jgi:sugar phosphate isomerase/epimerase
MRFSFSTGTLYPFPLATSLRIARNLGYDGVELALGPEAFYLGSKPLLRAIERYGIPVLSVHPPFARMPGWPTYVRDRLPRVARLARELGAEVAVTHTVNFYTPASHRNGIFAEAINLAQVAAGAGVAVSIENNQYYHGRLRGRIAYLDRIDALVPYARARECGVTFDTCHSAASGEDVLATYEAMRPLLLNVHLNDMRWVNGRPQTHLVPGDGELPMRDLLQRLVASDYDGLVTLELHPRHIGWWGPGCLRRAEEALGRALSFIRAAVRDASPTPVTAELAD